MILNEEQIIERILREPSQHLAYVNLECYSAYELGYTSALLQSGATVFERVVSREKYERFLIQSFGIPDSWPSNVRIESYLDAVSDSEREAFEASFSAKRGAREAFDGEGRYETLDGWIGFEDLLVSIATRPGMYFGNDYSAFHLGSLINGYLWAERDLGLAESELVSTIQGFQAWYEKKEPYSRGIPWYKTIRFAYIGDRNDSLQHFFADLSDFVEGREPDFRFNQHMERIQAAIMKRTGERETE